MTCREQSPARFLSDVQINAIANNLLWLRCLFTRQRAAAMDDRYDNKTRTNYL